MSSSWVALTRSQFSANCESLTWLHLPLPPPPAHGEQVSEWDFFIEIYPDGRNIHEEAEGENGAMGHGRAIKRIMQEQDMSLTESSHRENQRWAPAALLLSPRVSFVTGSKG